MPTTQAEGALVIKLGGAALAAPGAAQGVLEDVAALVQAGRRVVLVHGGGPQVSGWAERLGVESHFVDGLRATSPELMALAQMVQVGQVGRGVVERLARLGVSAIGVSGQDLGGWLRASVHPNRALGRVGQVTAVHTHALQALMDAGMVPVIAPVAVDGELAPLNVNADHVAACVAAALHARDLLVLTDVVGVLDPQGQVAQAVDEALARAWMDSGHARGGMRPKLRGCVHAARNGVRAVIGGGDLCALLQGERGTVVTAGRNAA
jgi:acetylglutamate kinase